MAFSYHNSKGTTYYLHGRLVKLRNGREQQIFFSTASEGGLDQPPAGYAVREDKASGLPVLKKTATG